MRSVSPRALVCGGAGLALLAVSLLPVLVLPLGTTAAKVWI